MNTLDDTANDEADRHAQMMQKQREKAEVIFGDLTQEKACGLIAAIKRFDKEKELVNEK